MFSTQQERVSAAYKAGYAMARLVDAGRGDSPEAMHFARRFGCAVDGLAGEALSEVGGAFTNGCYAAREEVAA